MALIRCPECGNSISDRAEKCPHCGLPASYFSSLSKNTPHMKETGLDYKNLQNVLISFERDHAQLFSAEHYISHRDAQRLRDTYGKYNESLSNKLIFQYVCNNAAAIRVDIDLLRRFLRQMQSLNRDITAHNTTYPNGFTALKGINLQIEQGEFVAIIGLSGAGKSTILRCINRMHDITKGELTVDGVDVDALKGKTLRRYRRKVGMIFQSFNLVSRSTAIKNVLTADVPDMNFFRVLFGIFTKDQKMRALESLDKVGILDKAYTRCDQLSGGQQQRVALARTLNQNPKIILADEPVASLDPITAKQVMEDFVRINKEYNISILLNIHHVDLALKYCDRVIGVRAGEIVFDGPASTITQEQIDAVYNGTKVPTMGDGE